MFRKERKKKDGFSDGWSFHPWQTFVSDTRTWRWEAAKNTDFFFFFFPHLALNSGDGTWSSKSLKIASRKKRNTGFKSALNTVFCKNSTSFKT